MKWHEISGYEMIWDDLNDIICMFENFDEMVYFLQINNL